MGRIKDIVEGRVSSFKDAAKNVTGSISSAFRGDTGRGRPDGSTLGISTPTKMTGNTAIGPSGGSATQFGTTTSSGRLTDVHAVGSQTPRNPGDPSSYSRSSGGDKASGTTGTKTSPSTSSRNPNVSTDKSGRGPRYAKGGKVERTKMAKKNLPREEMAEFKKGKYMGGPTEEKAEKKAKKKPAKRMAMGGMTNAAMSDKMARGPKLPFQTNYPGIERPGRGNEGMGDNVAIGRPALRPLPGMPKPGTPIMNDPGFSRDILPGLGGRMPKPRPVPGIPGATYRGMRGGGLARKGVGQALKTGGLVKGAGCAKRGVKKARNV